MKCVYIHPSFTHIFNVRMETLSERTRNSKIKSGNVAKERVFLCTAEVEI